MKSEFIVGQNAIDIHRYLRRIKARLIRMIPRRSYDGRDSFLIMYVFLQP